jgi:hypothetical protein
MAPSANKKAPSRAASGARDEALSGVLTVHGFV